MGKTEGIFLNLQCDCHRVASIFIKRINHYTNFSTLLLNVTALNGVSLNSPAHYVVGQRLFLSAVSCDRRNLASF